MAQRVGAKRASKGREPAAIDVGRSNPEAKTSTAARRLHDALGEPGAYGAPCAHDDAFVCVMAPRKGVSVQSAKVAATAAAELEQAGLVRWRRTATTRRLELVIEGEGDALAPVRQETRYDPRPEAADAQRALLNDSESPLAWLAKRKLVTPAEFAAGERLRSDLTAAQAMPRVTANWSTSVSRGARGASALHITEQTIAARQRIEKAMAAVGPEFGGLLRDVCGFLKRLELVESERGWPRRSAKVVLCMALAQLARHYGFSGEARGRDRQAMRHWGTADHRPAIGELR